MSRSEEFNAAQGPAQEPEWRVYSVAKDGTILYEIPHWDAVQYTDYVRVTDAREHMKRAGMAWRYDGDNNVFKRAKISHHVLRQLLDGRPALQFQEYPAGWRRGDPEPPTQRTRSS